MKFNKWLSLLFIINTTFIFYGCENENEPLGMGFETILTSTTWKLSSLKLDEIEFTYDCLLDNTVKFNTNKTYSASAGNSLCDENEFYERGGIFSGRWNLVNSGRTLEFRHDDANDDFDAEIIKLTSSELILSSDFLGGIGIQTFIPNP